VTGHVPALSECGFSGEGYCAAYGIGLRMTRHPSTGAARSRGGIARELVESRGAKAEKNTLGVAIEHREVSAGELVDSKGSHE